MDRLQMIESEADDLIIRLLGEVYNGKYEPVQAMFVRDLYDLLEKIIDRCRDVGNVISHIALKNADLKTLVRLWCPSLSVSSSWLSHGTDLLRDSGCADL